MTNLYYWVGDRGIMSVFSQLLCKLTGGHRLHDSSFDDGLVVTYCEKCLVFVHSPKVRSKI